MMINDDKCLAIHVDNNHLEPLLFSIISLKV